MPRAIAMIAALALGFAGLVPSAMAGSRDRPVDIRALNNLDCTLRFTNDYVQDVIMMQDTTGSPDACRAACARYAEQALIGMRDAVYVLRYTCSYRDRVVADIDLK